MAVFGLGSYDEPIVLSDDEDATHVENELNRWNDSPSSSPHISLVVKDHSAYLSPLPIMAVPVPTLPTTVARQKRKRQESVVASGSNASASDRPAKKKKKKQKQKVPQDSGRLGKSDQDSLHHSEYRSIPARYWDVYLSGGDSHRTADFSQAASGHSMRSITTPEGHPLVSAPPYWPSSTERRNHDSHHAQYSSLPHASEDGPLRYPPDVHTRGYPTLPPQPLPAPRPPKSVSGAHRSPVQVASFSSVYLSQVDTPLREVSSTLDESLRRLQVLSASLIADTTSSLAPIPAKPRVASSHTTHDKRRIGKLNDKANAACFDLGSPSLLPSTSSTLPPPVAGRTVILAHLPKKFRQANFVTKWAQRFGAVTRLELDSKPGKALVEYRQAAHAEAAFTSFKLHGEGREHIRVYWYKGAGSSLSVPATRTSRTDIEEGEIEEGELLEAANVYVTTKSKKKKGKKKAQAVEKRPHDPAPIVPRRLTHGNTIASSSSRYSARPVVPPLPPPRPPLEERFSDAPVVAEDNVSEEEMDMDSEDDYPEQLSASSSPPLLATLLPVSPGGLDAGSWEVDMDLAMSSPTASFAHLPPSIASRRTSFKRSRSPPILSAEGHRPGSLISIPEPRPHGQSLEATETPKFSNAKLPTSDSSGLSATPEPATPAMDECIVSLMNDATPLVCEDHNTAISLDDLAVSFINESIQGVTALIPQPQPMKLPPLPIPHPLPPKPPSPTVLTPQSHVVSPTMSIPTPQLSESVQLQVRKKRLEEYIAASKELLGKISVAKTKSEKNMFMRLLKERQLAMDHDLRGGPASPSTPGARVASAMPIPVSKSTPFRWPQTPREVVIDISDDEADGAS
ncbi:hypothetical protein BC628DRAFT_786909 [Trametes gibbosa]|nr:hypothetical protein BC628DRAFT_786909 [Trametes gibbosa]